MNEIICHISKQALQPNEAQKGEYIRTGVLKLIQKDHPEFDKNSWISTGELNKYRKNYLTHLIKRESGELNKIENEVVASIANNKILSQNIESDIQEKFTIGQRVADKIATFGGSWTFLTLFFLFILLWMAVNIFILVTKPFDPFPFILLNLILSCLAAVQAPVIMMSQNRKEAKDRMRSEHDYQVNLKAELEIRLLHEKLDHLMIHQNKRLLEIQELQTDYLQDISNQMNNFK